MTRLTRSLLCAVVFAACSDGTAPAPTGDPSGAYTYLARVGFLAVVEGRVDLLVADDSSVTGTWKLQRVLPNTGIEVGPQVGTGTLLGRRTDTGIWLDLNPGWADNNVFLALHPDSPGALSGTWDHSTIAGPVIGGAVRLQRLQR